MFGSSRYLVSLSDFAADSRNTKQLSSGESPAQEIPRSSLPGALPPKRFPRPRRPRPGIDDGSSRIATWMAMTGPWAMTPIGMIIL